MYYKITYRFVSDNTKSQEHSNYLNIDGDIKMIDSHRTLDTSSFTVTSHVDQLISEKSMILICNAIIAHHSIKDIPTINIFHIDMDYPFTQSEYDEYYKYLHTHLHEDFN